MSDTLDRARARLAVARTRLILDRPFVGALALHLIERPADPAVCPTVGTDGRRFWFNSAFVESAAMPELQFWLAHAALHCALGHFARRRHRVHDRWDAACDHAVNGLLQDDGFPVPRSVIVDPSFRGLSAEEIYPLMPESDATPPLDLHAFEEGASAGGLSGWLGDEALGDGRAGGDRATADRPGADHGTQDDAFEGWDDAGQEARRSAPSDSGLSDAPPAMDMAELEQWWKSRLATAAQEAREAGRLGRSWVRILEALIEPPLPWRALLARFLVTAARDDYTFQQPPRRESEAILPRLARGSLRVVAILDTSGSITARELNEFTGELDALKGQVRAELVLHACDERLAPEGPWIFDPWEPVALPQALAGGGGTRFTPVFDWVEGDRVCPDVLIYFTDAQGEFPESAPPYPVLWLVKGRAPVPFGERVQLN